jgi:transcriptional regulator with XRE-family HTH domain
MNERIKQLRKDVLELSQKDFADKIGVSENFIWMVEKGTRTPSDRTISDICREFGVREEWLRTGELPIKKSLSRQAEITKFVGDAMRDAKKSDTQRILTALMDATPAEIEAIVSFARRIAEQYENEKDRP